MATISLHPSSALQQHSSRSATTSSLLPNPRNNFNSSQAGLGPPDWPRILEGILSWATCPLTLDELRDLIELHVATLWADLKVCLLPAVCSHFEGPKTSQCRSSGLHPDPPTETTLRPCICFSPAERYLLHLGHGHHQVLLGSLQTSMKPISLHWDHSPLLDIPQLGPKSFRIVWLGNSPHQQLKSVFFTPRFISMTAVVPALPTCPYLACQAYFLLSI